ncbi:MAG TPA: hypothetical protein VJ825_08845 [Gemmatimonadaceae bacterium]|nr:hypothetical protein [Gemmatimonadaceae bacterium]
MFLGHYGLAFAARRAAPRTSLGTLTFAAQFLDELWPILLLAGVEQVRLAPWLIRLSSSTLPNDRYPETVTPIEFSYYPYSHSLLMALVWAVVIGGIYFAIRRYGRGGWIVGLLVLSHWFLDLPMHRADLPLWFGDSSPKFGWGVWNSLIATYLIEFGIYAVGVFAYARVTRARDRIGSWGLWTYVILLAAIYIGSNGPPPASERALALSALGIWVFVPLAWWVDKHRYYTGRVDIPIEHLSGR